MQKRASQVLIYQKTCKNVQNRAKTCKNVYLKYFWTQFKNVHLRGPCSLRPCISRPYCNIQCVYGSCKLVDGSKTSNLVKTLFSNK